MTDSKTPWRKAGFIANRVLNELSEAVDRGDPDAVRLVLENAKGVERLVELCQYE